MFQHGGARLHWTAIIPYNPLQYISVKTYPLICYVINCITENNIGSKYGCHNKRLEKIAY
jgi:hypothetical protein